MSDLQQNVDYERLEGALVDSRVKAKVLAALGFSARTLRRRMVDENLRVSEYDAIIKALGVTYDRYLEPGADEQIMAKAMLLGRWNTLHVEYKVDESTASGKLVRRYGIINVEHDGEGVALVGSHDGGRRIEKVTRSWYRHSTLAFESIIEDWPIPSGVSVTLMFLAPNKLMRGYTTFYDEILDKPFFSPHIAYRDGVKDTFVWKQAMHWFTAQVKAAEVGIRGTSIPLEGDPEANE